VSPWMSHVSPWMSHVSPWDVARDVADVASDAGDLNRQIRDLAHKTFRKWRTGTPTCPGAVRHGCAVPILVGGGGHSGGVPSRRGFGTAQPCRTTP